MFKIITKPYRLTQKFVDNIGMYRLVSGSLGVLAGFSILFGFLGLIAYSGISQIFSLAVALLVALVVNILISAILRIPANHESAVITGFILFFLTIPEVTVTAVWPLVLAVTIGVASKYVVVYKKQHFLNPAAFGAATLSVTGLYTFSWWVANPVLFVPLLVCGVLVVMKVRKWVPVLSFVGVSLLIYIAESMSYGTPVADSLNTFFTSWPTLFLAFYMLTEPFTMPATKGPQFLYGGLVGFLSNTSVFMGVVSFTPELALVVANVLMLPSRLRQKLFLTLVERQQIAKDTYEFVFKKPNGFSFKAGQYLEWMLPHKKSDNKGPRRYFTIASSPTEDVVRVAMKIMDNRSTYKSTLAQLDTEKMLIASQLAGDFLLPKNTDEKLAFIAGGIGVTPFRSHVKYMMDSGKAYDATLFYCVNFHDELAYGALWNEAEQKIGMKYIPVLAKENLGAPYETGFVTAEMIQRLVPDYLERTWYISGPPGMVSAYGSLLRGLHIPHRQIVKDFFPGV